MSFYLAIIFWTVIVFCVGFFFGWVAGAKEYERLARTSGKKEPG